MSRKGRALVLCGGIIVAVPHHAGFLHRLVSGFARNTRQSVELIVVASGFSTPEAKKLTQSLEGSCGGVLTLQAPLQSAGANRNLGLENSKAEILFFMDADDLYSPYRIDVALALFERHRFDLMLHGFHPFAHGEMPPEFPSPPGDTAEIEVVDGDDLYSATLLREPRNRPLELKGKTESTNLLFNDTNKAFEVHHAHAIVRREAIGDIRYHEEFGIRNEDGVFARDMLEAGRKVLLTPFVLSAYRHGARAKPTRRKN